jgi:hypothetical protein
LYSIYHTKETVEGFGDFRIGGRVIHTEYSDDLVLQVKEETVVQSVID